MAKIYLDAGHGGSDPGAVNGNRTEAADVLKMTLAVGKLLEAQSVQVKYSRTTDTSKKLAVRTSESNSWGADYYLSIHRNSASASATGNEIWVIKTATANTQAKAKTILDAVCAADGLRNRGVKCGAPSYNNFAVNRDTNCASALLEMGFISNTGDSAALDKNFDAIALGIAKALCSIVGVTYKTPSVDGDVNGDGKLTTADARDALRAAVGLDNLSAEQKKKADANGDGSVTTSDARDLLRKATGLES